MVCAACRQENVTGAKFCSECGAPLVRRCEGCNATLPTAAKFCPECGRPVAQSAVATPAPPPTVPQRFASPETYTPARLAEKILGSRTAMEGERKHVTVLFADLRGSMELLADRDPEDARHILDQVLERMMEAVHWYEGTVNQVMGDGIMALFGAPVALEDHAVRACYAAVRMAESIRRFAEEIRQRSGAEVQIRVGLNSGEVVVRSVGNDLRMDYSAVGQTTHLAARMEQMARPGSVLMSPATFALVEGYVHVTSRGLTAVKGLAEPIEVFELSGVNLIRSRLQTNRDMARFVGRGAEVQALATAFGRARAGQGQVLAVAAEAGVGKSRLFAEFLRSDETEGSLILETGCISYRRASAWLPIIELLRTYFQIDADDPPHKASDKVVGKVLSLDETLEPHVPAFLWLLDVPIDDDSYAWANLDPQRRRQRALEGVKRLLLRETRVQPVIVVVEDLHWVDTETQQLLDGLVSGLEAARMLLMVNYRPEYQHAWGNKTWYQQLRIDVLPRETADELLTALLGDDSTLAELKSILIERTGRNPFFLEEAVQALRDSGALQGERGRYRLGRRVSEIQVPATVQAILAARMDRLPEGEKRLLQAMAVAGTEVSFALLREIADVEDDDLRRSLMHLQEADFVYESCLFPDIEYTFRHALIHDVAYHSLVRERRRTLHGRIVGAIERLSADRLAENVERLGHHAFRGELWDKAIGYLRQAGTRAHGRFANREAVAWFEQALTVIPRLPDAKATTEQAIDLRLDLRTALYPLGEFDKILECLGEARGLAHKIDDAGREGWVSLQIGDALRQSGRIMEAIPPMESARTMAERSSDLGLKLAAHQYLGLLRYAAGDFRDAFELMHVVIATDSASPNATSFGRTNSGSRAGFISINLSWLARSLAERGEFTPALMYGEQGVALANSIDDPYSRALACIGLGYVYLLKGDVAEAIPLLERARAATRERSMPLVELQALRNLGLAKMLAGETDNGLALVEEALREVDSRRFTVQQATVVILLAEAYLFAGRIDDALALATRGLALAGERGQRGEAVVALRLLGEIAARQPPVDRDAAERYFQTAAGLAAELGMQPQEARCQLGLGHLYLEVAAERAEEHLASATIKLSELGMTLWARQALALLGRLGRLLIVSRDRRELFERLSALVTVDDIRIVLDRRLGSGTAPDTERRASRIDDVLATRGLATVLRDAAQNG